MNNILNIRARWQRLDPFVADVLLAVGLMLLMWLQIWAFTSFRPEFVRFPAPIRRPQDASLIPYVFSAAAFLPLMLRRRVPWLAVLLTSLAALLYSTSRMPPAMTILGPMVALYSLAAYTKERRTTLITLLLAGSAIAIPAYVFSNISEVVESTGLFVMLAAAALLGDTARSRRAYIEAVEQRAIEAERTRDEEARRRVDEERIRIAREVHDIIAHSLSIVNVQASAGMALLDADNPARARESLGHVRDTSKQALAELRSMLDVLRTGEGDAPLGPIADISQFEKLVQPVRDAGIAVDLSIDFDPTLVPAYASVSAYRIVQEALTNTVRHAGASRVQVQLTVRDGLLEIEVTDDGTSTEAPIVGATSGHGLRGMSERVDALGGTFSAGPMAKGGFHVSASIPVTRSV